MDSFATPAGPPSEVGLTGRMPWMVILVDVADFLGGGAGAPDELSWPASLAAEDGGEADTLETTDDTTDRSTVTVLVIS
jgi:hypothetical protein